MVKLGWFDFTTTRQQYIAKKTISVVFMLLVVLSLPLRADSDLILSKITKITRAYLATFISDPSLYAVQVYLIKKHEEKRMELPGFTESAEVPVDYLEPEITIILEKRIPAPVKERIRNGLSDFYEKLNVTPRPMLFVKEQNLVGSFYDSFSGLHDAKPQEVKVTLASNPQINVKVNTNPEFKIRSILEPPPITPFEQIMRFRLLFAVFFLAIVLMLIVRKFSHQLGVKFDELCAAFKTLSFDRPPAIPQLETASQADDASQTGAAKQTKVPSQTKGVGKRILPPPPPKSHLPPPSKPLPVETVRIENLEGLEKSYLEIREYFMENPGNSVSMVKKWLRLPEGKYYLKGFFSILGFTRVEPLIRTYAANVQRACEAVIGDQLIVLTKLHMARAVQEIYQFILFEQHSDSKKAKNTFHELNKLDKETLLKGRGKK